MFHMTNDPLLEEYSIVLHVFGLTLIDLSEVARNSVLQSGYSYDKKKEFICGQNYNGKFNRFSNCIDRTNVPDCRLQFRKKMLEREIAWIKGGRITFKYFETNKPGESNNDIINEINNTESNNDSNSTNNRPFVRHANVLIAIFTQIIYLLFTVFFSCISLIYF